jgi:hypothetical protein
MSFLERAKMSFPERAKMSFPERSDGNLRVHRFLEAVPNDSAGPSKIATGPSDPRNDNGCRFLMTVPPSLRTIVKERNERDKRDKRDERNERERSEHCGAV